jgi:hypothetical protein
MRHAPTAGRAAIMILLAGVPAGAQSLLQGRQFAAAFSLQPLSPSTGPSVAAPVGPSVPSPDTVTSGFVPPECRALYDAQSPRLVDCWLAQNPHVAQAIRWEFSGDGAAIIASWPEWGDESRQAVRDAFVQARRWRASGMKTWSGTPFQDPPENKEAPYLGPNSVTTVLDRESAAWPYYAAHVGFSVAAEIDSWVPWTIRDYDADALVDLFDGPRRMYTYDAGDGSANDTIYTGYSPQGTVTPAHPTTAFRFFADNHLIGASPKATIAAVLEWSRRHMQDTVPLSPSGGDDPARLMSEAYWQYSGKAPLSRLLAGTRVSDPRRAQSFPETTSWTAGCAMSTDAIVWLMRSANIPARRAGSSSTTCNHFTPYFSAEKVYVSHGSDAYNLLSKTASFSMEELLIPARIWQMLYPKVEREPWCWNVGRRVIDLNLRTPSEHLVGLYCADTRAGVSQEDGQVHAAFRNLYTISALRQQRLWERLASRAQTSTAEACVQLRAGR